MSCDTNCIDGSGTLHSDTRTPGPFSGIKLGISANVQVEHAAVAECTISAQQNILQTIETSITDGTLYIHSDACFGDCLPITIRIKSPDVSKLIVNGSGSIATKGRIAGDRLEFGLNGSGTIKAEVDAQRIYGGLKGSGSIELTGTAKDQFVKVSGSGSYNASDVPTVRSDVSLSGSGEIRIYAIDKLNASLNGSGNILYKGSPQTSINSNGSGRVEKIR